MFGEGDLEFGEERSNFFWFGFGGAECCDQLFVQGVDVHFDVH